MRINNKIEYILDKGIEGQGISRDEALELMKVDEKSPEMYALMSTGNSLRQQKSGDIGEINSQVGINVWPCPKNCKFCFFGEKWKLIKEPMELSPEQVVFRAQELERAGANNIFLMTTANYPFEKFIDIAREVRRALSPEMSLSANIGDFGPDEARLLEDTGFQGAYHIERLREGIDTEIDPSARKRTLAAIRDSGLSLNSCLEPIGPEHTDDELVDAMFRAGEFKAATFAVMKRFPVPGTPLAEKGKISNLKLAKAAAVSKIVLGRSINVLGVHGPEGLVLAAGANVISAETGSNPRDTTEDTSKGIGLSVETCKRILRDAGFTPLEGFSRAFHKEK